MPQNTTAPVGKVRGELEDQSIRLLGWLESPSEFEQMIIKRRGTDVAPGAGSPRSRTALPR